MRGIGLLTLLAVFGSESMAVGQDGAATSELPAAIEALGVADSAVVTNEVAHSVRGQGGSVIVPPCWLPEPMTCAPRPQTCAPPRPCPPTPQTCVPKRPCPPAPQTCAPKRPCVPAPQTCSPKPRLCPSMPQTCMSTPRPLRAFTYLHAQIVGVPADVYPPLVVRLARDLVESLSSSIGSAQVPKASRGAPNNVYLGPAVGRSP